MSDTVKISDDDIFAMLATVSMAFLPVVNPSERHRIHNAVRHYLNLQLTMPEPLPHTRLAATGKRRGRPRKTKNGVAAPSIAAE
jgi:hypothetical protein